MNKLILTALLALAMCFLGMGCANGEVEEEALDPNQQEELDYNGTDAEVDTAVEPDPPVDSTPDCLAGALPNYDEGSVWNPKLINVNETYDAIISEGAVSNKNLVVEVEPNKEYTVEFTDYEVDYTDLEDFARNIKISASEELYAEEFIYEKEIPEGEFSHSFTIQSSTGCLFLHTSTYATKNKEVPFKVKVSP